MLLWISFFQGLSKGIRPRCIHGDVLELAIGSSPPRCRSLSQRTGGLSIIGIWYLTCHFASRILRISAWKARLTAQDSRMVSLVMGGSSGMPGTHGMPFTMKLTKRLLELAILVRTMTAETNGSLSSLTLLTIPLTLISMTIVKESLLAKKRRKPSNF